MRCLRFDHGAQWNVLPLPQLRQQHGVQLTTQKLRQPVARAGRRDDESLANQRQTHAADSIQRPFSRSPLSA
jgi:hypothetical protein